MWDSWFGTSQKYAPSSIVQSGRQVESDGDYGSGASDDDLGAGLADGDYGDDPSVDYIDGGSDGRQDDAAASGNAAQADQDVLVDSDQVPAAQSAAPSVAPPPPLGSPSGMPSPPLLSPTAHYAAGAGVGGRGRGRGRGGGASAASALTANVIEQKALLTQHVMGRPVVSSPSQSGSSSSGKNTFDAVYAEAAKNKCAVMVEISNQRSATETRHQESEHSFKREERRAQQDFQKELDLQKQALEHKFLQQQQAVNLLAQRQERKIQKDIEYDKTLASLLIADKSGALADNFETRRKRERDADGHDMDPVSSFLLQLLPRDRARD